MRKNKIISKKYLSRSGSMHWAWKGDKVGYVALHEWIVALYGKADHCDSCGITKKPKGKKYWFEWSSKNAKYTRNIKDWWQLCIPCHRKFDKWREKVLKKYIKSKCWEKRTRLNGQFK